MFTVRWRKNPLPASTVPASDNIITTVKNYPYKQRFFPLDIQGCVGIQKPKQIK